MAARIRKHHQDEIRFYVYALKDEAGRVMYVGKGSGRRLECQKRKFGLAGEILERHASEAKAYAAEVRLIAEMNPPLNKHPGGNGSRAKAERVPSWVRDMSRIGTQRFAARLLMSVLRVRPDLIPASKVEAIRQVAYG